MIQEEAIVFGKKSNLLGVMTKAPDTRYRFAAIFLNAGLIHHVGPQRMYVNMARELARMGVHSFRFDFSGIGDSLPSDEALSYEEMSVHEVKMAMEHLKRVLNIDRFLLIGLCSGAEIAFKTAMDNDGVTGCVLINGIYLEGHEYRNIIDEAFRKNKIRYYIKNVFKLKKWIRFFSGKSKGAIGSILKKGSKASQAKSIDKPIPVNYDGIRVRHELVAEKGVNVIYIFSEGSVAWDIYNLHLKSILNKNSSWKNYRIRSLQKTDHTFTSVKSQSELKQCIVEFIQESDLK